MSQISIDMNIHQGINFDKSVVDKVGYITKLTVGKTTFDADGLSPKSMSRRALRKSSLFW